MIATTGKVVSRLFLDGDRDKPKASRRLDALVADGVLYRYRQFYMKEPLRAFEIDRRYRISSGPIRALRQHAIKL